jgi:thiol-disulfide isomerase/thioredoxin
MVPNRNARLLRSTIRGALGCGLVLICSLPACPQEKKPPAGAPAAASVASPSAKKSDHASDSRLDARQLKLPQDVAPNETAGVVVDSQGKPLADVLVDAWTWYPGDETRTDANGVFRLKPGSSDAQYVEVRFSKPGYSPHYIPQQPRGQKNFVVTLGNKTYLEGTVRSPEGKPVAGATINGEQAAFRGNGFIFSGVSTSTVSDAKGHYRLYLFPSTYEIQVAVEGVGSTRLTGVSVLPDKSQNIDIDLKPGVRFEAKVVDANTRQPVEKLVLFNWRDSKIRGVSDAQGKIVIEGMLPGKYEFNVEHGEPKKIRGMTYYDHGELGRWWSAQAVNEWERKTIEQSGWQRNFDGLTFELSIGMKPVAIEVEKGVVFSGHVYDPDGNPVFAATVAPAKTGSGNSLTGDTRYSVKTASDGSYRDVMPAGNSFVYNLVAHDGDYGRWRKWANSVSEPIKTKPGQRFENFDFKLTRGATVRGRVVADGGRVVGNREVRSEPVDLRENRYYDPTVKVRSDGSFELKFIRPGKQYIQVSPFWLATTEAPGRSSVELELKPAEVREGVELHVAPSAEPVAPLLAMRTFRVKLLDHAGAPAAHQRLTVVKRAGPALASRGFAALVGSPSGLAKRLERESWDGEQFITGADGVVAISGTTLFDQHSTIAMAVALNPDREEGALGVLYADLQTPDITLRLSPFCDTTASISNKKLPDRNSATHVHLQSGGFLLASASVVDDRIDLQLPMGEYTLTVENTISTPQVVKFTVKANQEQLNLGLITLIPTRLAALIGKPAPELRGIADWGNGAPLKLADLRGKVVILDFWGYWCGPCLASMPSLMKIYDEYPQKDVAIIAVHDGTVKNVAQLRDRTESAKKQFWKGRVLPFHLAVAGGGLTKIEGTKDSANAQVVADYGITAFPTTLLIDQQGKIVAQLDPRDVSGTKKRLSELLHK